MSIKNFFNPYIFLGHLDIVTLLIRCEANILQADNDGVNPVAAASRAGHLSVLEHLLDQVIGNWQKVTIAFMH